MRFSIAAIVLLSVSSASAAVNSLCLSTCYRQALTTAGGTCTASLTLDDHESRDAFLCACSTTFSDATVACATTARCADTPAELLAEIKEQCDHLGEHWNPDGTPKPVEGEDHSEHEGEDHDHDHDHEGEGHNSTLPATRVRTRTSTKTMALPTSTAAASTTASITTSRSSASSVVAGFSALVAGVAVAAVL
ncbi:hypothetical protein BC829DRAFT_417579 [Chytridium lagenaria]|nr:hypothetical protein BC829DRAFT_417579 [Chytridium lagenaria]